MAASLLVAALLLYFTACSHGQAIQDSRCYLMNGGAVESFFIGEDTPVGAVIGTLSVNGDPTDDGGDITLKLQERGAAVGIAPGSKNLTLLRPLDREEKHGPSNVYVNVRCDRRRTTDPSFIIPVSVRVWDVNDNEPQWVGAPFRARLSEQTSVGSRVLPSLKATDADQPGPHATIHYSVLPGPFSEYFSFPNELESTLVVAKPLDYETARNMSVTLRASDGGRPALHADAALHVELLDADDQNPSFSKDHYTAVLPENAIEGTFLEVSPEPIKARDQDVGINAPLYYSLSGERRAALHVERDTGRVAATGELLRRDDFPITVVIKATQVDNPDRYALSTLTITGPTRASRVTAPRPGVRFTRHDHTIAVSEDAAPGTALHILHTQPHYATESPLQFYVSDRSFLEKFAINSNGEVILRKQLDYETTNSYFYQVMVTDGTANDTASLNITVLNVNEWEPRFKHAQYEFSVEPAGEAPPQGEAPTAPGPAPSPPGPGLLRVGKLEVFDGDTADTLTLTLRGSASDMFEITQDGEMFMKAEALTDLNTTVLHVVATAVDSGSPPRQSSVPVVVHVSSALMRREARVLLLFAAALALLALLVLALLAYIYRVRRRPKPSPAPSKPSPTVLPPMSKPLASTLGSGVGAGGTGVGAGGASGSLLSVSAGASTILANSCSSLDLRDPLPNNGAKSATVGRQSQRFPTKTKVAPAPPALSPGSLSGRPLNTGVGGGVALMSNHLEGIGGRSGVAWPADTIPARVKKLSWDDNTNKEVGAVEEIHDATNPALADHMNLTVYF